MKQLAAIAIDALSQLSSEKNVRAKKKIHEALLQLESFEKILFDKNGRKYITYERLQELVQADAEGKIIVMPCHLNEKMYRVWIAQKPSGNTQVSVRPITLSDNNLHRILFENELGVTVFPTEFEAIAAAKKIKNGFTAKE